jgi:hypothetical protein
VRVTAGQCGTSTWTLEFPKGEEYSEVIELITWEEAIIGVTGKISLEAVVDETPEGSQLCVVLDVQCGDL